MTSETACELATHLFTKTWQESGNSRLCHENTWQSWKWQIWFPVLLTCYQPIISCHSLLHNQHISLHLWQVKLSGSDLSMSPPPVKKKWSPLQCFKCTRHKLNFDKIDDYKVYNLNKHPRWFTCKDCGKSYQSNHHLNQHVTSIHLGMPYAYNVQGCAQFFTKSKGKDLYMATHRTMPVYKCNSLYAVLALTQAQNWGPIKVVTWRVSLGSVTGVGWAHTQI